MSASILVMTWLLVLFLQGFALAGTTEPKRTIEAVHVNSIAEEMKKLANPRIVIADYDLIRKDFPQMANKSNPEIDRWILDQVGYVSIPQTQQEAVNTAIPTLDQTREAFRPPNYGRAAVFEMVNPDNGQKIGLIDVKGSGSLNPGQRDHGNGVATLGECIREYNFENMMRDVVEDAGLPNKTVGSYAVIDPGFDVRHADGSTSPAGYYLRQAHDRVPDPGAWLPADKRASLQNVFRKYGIDPNENIQGTKKHDLFDFGHYIVRDDMPEIIPEKAVPFHVWGYNKNIPRPSGDRWFYSKRDNGWNWSHDLARAWRQGRANRDSAWQHFLNMNGPVREKLAASRHIGCGQIMGNILGH